ncbi:MAG: 3-deoxy-D-manno-octulosonic acid transferase [Bacteroidetes bacterium]|nr:3-deoxy-D-manno-octulosonic acid transferase [Bacteroidota bacterium]
MTILYNFSIQLTLIILKIAAFFNPKIKLFMDGRAETFSILKKKLIPTDRVIWFHCASLGEFEQGRPVIEKTKLKFPNHKIVVTFFSPSGYEIRKNYNLADAVVYLPFDTIKNVKKFLELTNPELSVFVKYEFWPNLLSQLNKRAIPTILISGIFRENQTFFKFYGSWMRKKLTSITHFFVQDQTSERLLKSIGFSNTTISGDTRFDRVYEIVNQSNSIDFIEIFKNNRFTLVAGSTWNADENMLVEYINKKAKPDDKFIIAPHNINQEAIQQLKSNIKTKTICFSNYKKNELKEAQVFILDTIGLLTKVYSYADIAYVGGGFNNGIHNILEPATFGIPVIIGPKYQKFKEATELIQKNGCVVVENMHEFNETLLNFEDGKYRKQVGNNAKKYIESNIGASDLIVDFMVNMVKK